MGITGRERSGRVPGTFLLGALNAIRMPRGGRTNRFGRNHKADRAGSCQCRPGRQGLRPTAIRTDCPSRLDGGHHNGGPAREAEPPFDAPCPPCGMDRPFTSPSPGREASGAGHTSRAWEAAAGRSILRGDREAARRTIPCSPDTGRSRHGMDPSTPAVGAAAAVGAAERNTRARAPERTGMGRSSPCWSRSPGGHPPTVPEPRSEWPGPRRPRRTRPAHRRREE